MLALADIASAARRALLQHRRGVVAGAIAVLAGFGVAAFAVAPLAPDAAALPQRLVSEAVDTEPLAPQFEALAGQSMALSRSELTRSGDTADALLRRLGVADAAATAFLRSDPTARRLIDGRAGRVVQARATEDGTLIELIGRFPAQRAEQMGTHFTRISVIREGTGALAAREETAELQSQLRLASGTIRSSLFAASDEARIPDAIAVQMAEIFAADIDMHRELRRGDTFSVVYEALTADSEPITWNQGTGRVLAAEFINAGKAYQAFWYRGPDGRGGYFDPSGESKKRAFLASPMEFSRMTSGFAMRFHPILQSWRRHLGVDYAAPTGTPVRSVGDGTVESAGWQNGYGNVVQIRHGGDRTTLYAHLSRIDVKKGQRVEQGQRVGAVGATGWATGPHLHFEFRVRGQHVDPLRIAKASETIALPAALKPDFQATARAFQARLDVAETLLGAQARIE
ncbi:MAG TPA: peptidoglycan DD-metalloendopeptidase family protein [Burkholderiaceae bacterium]|nr:peptidoglycan DD-metalloendopeptidase family protein [Burkholderiaceae bacterium]